MSDSAPLRASPESPLAVGGPATVIIVDDDEAVRRSLRLVLRANGYAVQTFDSGRHLLDARLPSATDILLVDYVMPGMDGLALVRQLRQQGWQGAVVLISGRYDVNLASRAKADGVTAVLEKPLDKQALLAVLKRVGR